MGQGIDGGEKMTLHDGFTHFSFEVWAVRFQTRDFRCDKKLSAVLSIAICEVRKVKCEFELRDVRTEMMCSL